MKRAFIHTSTAGENAAEADSKKPALAARVFVIWLDF